MLRLRRAHSPELINSKIIFTLAAFIGAFAASLFAQAPGSLEPLDLNIVGTPRSVVAMTSQPDGKILIGGGFNSVLGVSRHNLVRLNVDGSLDTTFNPNPGGDVRAITVQPDGKILIGGLFSDVGFGTGRNQIARLNADGLPDPVFNPSANGNVYSVALQPDGKVLLAGDFTTLRPNGAATATTRNHIARVNPDGTLDTTFNPNANGTVSSIVIQPDGKILLGGSFTAIGATTRNRIARVRPVPGRDRPAPLTWRRSTSTPAPW